MTFSYGNHCRVARWIMFGGTFNRNYKLTPFTLMEKEK